MLCLRLRFDSISSFDMVWFGLEFYVFLFFFLFSFCLLVYYSGRTVLVFVVYGIPKPKLFFCFLLAFEVCMCVRKVGRN